MKIRILCWVVLSVFWSLPMLGQADSSRGSQSTEVFNDVIKVFGPPGAPDGFDAPTVLMVQGGKGGDGGVNNANSGAGGGISLSAGRGGVSSQDAGPGGSITLTAGNGGQSSELGGGGGSITLQPGRGICNSIACGLPGNLIVNLPLRGAVGIGTTKPTNTLEVVHGGTTLADSWTVRSSRRFKTNIQPLAGALDRVTQLQGVSYESNLDGRHEIGVIAEDVDQIVPEVVSRDPNTNQVQGVDYSRLSALLIEAVKSQQAEIQELKDQVEQLKAKALRQ